MRGFILPYLTLLSIIVLSLFTQCESRNHDDIKIEASGSQPSGKNKVGFLRFSSAKRLGNRLLGDHENEDDEDANNNKNSNNNGGGGRPWNEDNHYDCESMLHYLDYLPPECQHLGPSMPDYFDGAPTSAPTDMSGSDAFQNEDILIRMSFRVGFKARLRPRRAFRLRTAVANSASRILNQKSPFHVPKPVLNDAVLELLGTISSLGTAETMGAGRPNQDRPQDRPQGGPNRDNNQGRPGDRERPMSPWIDPNSIDPEALADEILDDETSNGQEGKGSRHKKGNLWLHHYNTDLFDEVTWNATTEKWHYPVEIKYFVFYNVLDHLVQDPRILANITRICWHIGNETLANGVLKQTVLEEIENEDDLLDDVGTDNEEDEDWISIMDDDDMDLDGMGGGVGAPTQNDLKSDFDWTYPTAFLGSTWGSRENFGLYLFIATFIFSTAMYCGARRNDGADNKPTLSPNGAPLFLTEEGVHDILSVGWKYQKQNTGDSSQLYLHVYDKSGVGYSKDNSMLMGGNELIAMNDNKPSATPSPSNTASTNSTTHHESTTPASSERKTSSRNSGESSRTPPSLAYASDFERSSNSTRSKSSRTSDRKSSRRKSGSRSARTSDRKSSRRKSGSRSARTSDSKDHGRKNRASRSSTSDPSGETSLGHSNRSEKKKKSRRPSKRRDKRGGNEDT